MKNKDCRVVGELGQAYFDQSVTDLGSYSEKPNSEHVLKNLIGFVPFLSFLSNGIAYPQMIIERV